MDRLAASLALIRPGNLAVVGLSVMVGSSGLWPAGGLWKVILAAASAMLVAGGGNSLNDYFDLEADRVNRPERPLPSGRLERPLALNIAFLSFLTGNALGWVVSAANGFTALAVTGLLAFYAWRGKRLALAGNLMVAVSCAAAFFYGGLAAGTAVLSIYPAVFAFLMHLAREMVKDVQDMEGDLAAGARTTAIALGRRKTLALASGVLALLALLTPAPFFLGIYGWRYLATVVLGVDLMLAVIIWRMLHHPDREGISSISFYLKINMLVGIMAICLGLPG